MARETLLPGALLTRVATSHIRVGTFEFFAARGDLEGLRLLADHVISRHYPEAAHGDRPYASLLELVTSRQAELIARWLLVGFIHGVMNTDNMSIAGVEQIDYPVPARSWTSTIRRRVFSLDRSSRGRYAHANQPQIATWNLARFAETSAAAQMTTSTRQSRRPKACWSIFRHVEAAYSAGIRHKLGLSTAEDGDLELAGEFSTFSPLTGRTYASSSPAE